MLRLLLLFISVFGAGSHGDIRSKLINGTPVNPGDFDEVVYISFGNARCTGTIVGPEVMITAAHCGSNGSTATFQVKQNQYSAVCTRAPLYPIKDHDVMVCKIKKPVTGIKFASVGGSARKGMKISLAGYGCISPNNGGSGGNDGILRWGQTEIVGFSFWDMVLKSSGGAALCFGDSGGPAFLKLNNPATEPHTLLGVNSKGNIRNTSYDARLDTKDSQGFLGSWQMRNSVQICGMSGLDCSGSVAPDDDDDTGSGNDCKDQLISLKTAKLTMDAAFNAIEICINK